MLLKDFVEHWFSLSTIPFRQPIAFYSSIDCPQYSNNVFLLLSLECPDITTISMIASQKSGAHSTRGKRYFTLVLVRVLRTTFSCCTLGSPQYSKNKVFYLVPHFPAATLPSDNKTHSCCGQQSMNKVLLQKRQIRWVVHWQTDWISRSISRKRKIERQNLSQI